MIEVQDLTKYFGATLAVNHVSFKVEKGEIYLDRMLDMRALGFLQEWQRYMLKPEKDPG